MDWSDFEKAAPTFAEAGSRLFTQAGGAAIGFLATVHRHLHLAPVCPIFCVPGVYLCVGRTTPKRRDLDDDGRFVLHAMLGANDEEFRVAGRGVLVSSPTERTQVHAAIQFAAFDRDDPIYRLDIERAMWGYWENAGQPGSRPVRQHWRAVERLR